MSDRSSGEREVMRPEAVDAVIDGLAQADITFGAHLPDSWMAPLIDAILARTDIQFIPVVNEGEGAAMCAGAWLGGRGAVLVMENSGIRVACEELARLGLEQGVPVLMVMPFRGDLGDAPSWAQPLGWTTRPILEALRITYSVIREPGDLRRALPAARTTMKASKNHVAIVIGRECFIPE